MPPLPYLAKLIKEAVPLRDAMERYGLAFNQTGFALCPFHGPERTASLSVKGRRWTCFGCNASGDVIDFVQRLYGTSFKAALDKLNQDYALNLPLSGRISPSRRAELERRAKAYAEGRRAKRAEWNEAGRAYWEALDLFLFWDGLERLFRPQSSQDEIPEAYANALWELPIARDRLDRAFDRMNELRRSNEACRRMTA